MENITKEKILGELAAIGFARLPDFISLQDGVMTVKDFADLTPEQGAAVASLEKGTGGLKLKFYDKLKALELLGKSMGIFDGGVSQQEDSGLLQAILDATRDAPGGNSAASRR